MWKSRFAGRPLSSGDQGVGQLIARICEKVEMSFGSRRYLRWKVEQEETSGTRIVLRHDAVNKAARDDLGQSRRFEHLQMMSNRAGRNIQSRADLAGCDRLMLDDM